MIPDCFGDYVLRKFDSYYFVIAEFKCISVQNVVIMCFYSIMQQLLENNLNVFTISYNVVIFIVWNIINDLLSHGKIKYIPKEIFVVQYTAITH